MNLKKSIEPVVFDIETTGLDHRRDKIFSYCLGYMDGNVSVHRLDGPDAKANMRILQDFFTDTSKAKICHNMHFEMNFISHVLSVPEDTVWHDTMLMSQILRNNSHSHALDQLAYHLADYPIKQDKEVSRLSKLYKNYKRIPKGIMDRYQIADGERTMLLFQFFWPKILNGGHKEDYEMEINMVKTTVRMEQVGVRLHLSNMNSIKIELEENINQLQIDTYNRFGRFINLSSDKQLNKLIYESLGYTPILLSEKTGEPRTNKDVLYEFRTKYPNEELFDWILKQRSYLKGISTIRQYEKYAIDDILYPNIGTNEASTGRQTSRQPNLQNVSRNESLKNPYHIPLRRCFRTHKNSILLLVDYQGIEMRLIVAEANDKIMLDILAQDGDVHQEAMECFRGRDYILRIKEENPSLFKRYRSVDKNAHFALGYGASMLKTAKTCGLNPKEFKDRYIRYKKRHPRIIGLLHDKLREVRHNGFVTTPFGRKLHLNQMEAHAGLNYLIQGTAAGILKRAQIRVDHWLKKTYNDEIRIILPIHDELIISLPRTYLKYKHQVIDEVSAIMCDMPEIKVKLKTEWKSTKTTWDKVKKEEM